MCSHAVDNKSAVVSIPFQKILHCANICFSAHTIAQPCRHTTSEAF